MVYSIAVSILIILILVLVNLLVFSEIRTKKCFSCYFIGISGLISLYLLVDIFSRESVYKFVWSMLNTNLFVGLIPLIVVVFAWGLNERSKRKRDIYKRKEEIYSKLIKNIPGFFKKTVQDDEEKMLEKYYQKKEFIKQYSLCWISVPKNVIKQINQFFEAIHKEKKTSNEGLNELKKTLILMRKDLNRYVNRGDLEEEDFMMLSPGENPRIKPLENVG